jgi:threonine dehydrogenase-like Zn-dependent dehydrogenase
VIFECAGTPGILQTILAGAVAGSQVVVIGAGAQPEPIVPLLALSKSISIDFAFAYTPHEFAQALTRVASGKLDVSPLVTSVIGLDAVGGLTERLRSGDELKVVVRPDLVVADS